VAATDNSSGQRPTSGGPVVVKQGPAVESFALGRVCAEDGCTTRLSRYNPDDVCALHKNPQYNQYLRWNRVR